MTRFASICAAFALLLASPLPSYAQAPSAPPPRGPADIIERARAPQPDLVPSGAPGADQAANQGALPPGHPDIGAPPPSAADGQNALPPGHPDVGAPPPSAADGQNALPPGHPDVGSPDAQEPPVGNDPHANMDGAPPLARRPLATAEPSAKLPAGTIHVRVLDGKEQPVANADLQLGTMSQEAGRTSQQAHTNADGTYQFEKLPIGERQAYRVNVLYQGAKYSSMPFRLPPDRGYDVLIRRIETTHDPHDIVLYVGATSVELKEDRLKIVQQARLVNIGAKTYVFPADGELVRFPKGAMAFQAEDVMTDQHMREDKSSGMRINGSIPPGEVTLTWGFDLPIEGDSADLSFNMPWLTFAYRVLADAAPGLKLEVDGFPAAELQEDNGRRFYVTELVKRVGETPLRAVHLRLTGIPGPGPMRFIAVGLALALMISGVFVMRRLGSPERQSAPLHKLDQEQAKLLARARELEAERERGEIGPEFHERATHELEEELAAVLYERARLAKQKPAKAAG